MGAELARFNPRVLRACQRQQFGEALSAERRRRRGAEARAQAAAGIGGQRELRHQQQAAAGVLERQVHAPFAVAEHAVAQQLLQQPLDLRRAVIGLNADQGQQAGLDAAGAAVVDIDARFGDALDQGDHAEWASRRAGAADYPG